jgi:hypothetical protein
VALGRLSAGEACCEIGARGDAEFLEDVCEVRLDGPSRDKKLLGDLRVALSLCGECRNSVLGWSERGDAGYGAATGAGPCRAELTAGAVGEQAHAAALGQVERKPEGNAGGGPSIHAVQRCA